MKGVGEGRGTISSAICHHQNDSSIKMGTGVSGCAVSLILWEAKQRQ